jgi:hypothetical protein
MMDRMKLLVALLCGLLAGCDADLKTTCTGGDRTCDPHALGGPPPPPPCLDDCDVQTPSGRTGEFPCAVEPILSNCQRCHSATPSLMGDPAPFQLDTYEQSQAIFEGMAVWARMFNAVDNPNNPDFMPLADPKLKPEEKTQLLDEWVCVCAPPREEGEVCN